MQTTYNGRPEDGGSGEADPLDSHATSKDWFEELAIGITSLNEKNREIKA